MGRLLTLRVRFAVVAQNAPRNDMPEQLQNIRVIRVISEIRDKKEFEASTLNYFDNVIFSYSCHCEERFLR